MAIWLKCHRCEYEWRFVGRGTKIGSGRYVRCPKCGTTVAIHKRAFEKDDTLKLSDWDIGYLAGVIDGDGSLTFRFMVRRTKTMGERPRVNVECKISSTVKELHERIAEILKGCKLTVYWVDRSKIGCKSMGYLILYARELRRILPLIRGVSAKKDQIDIILKVLKFTELNRVDKVLTDDDIEWLWQMQQRLIDLHGLQARKLLKVDVRRYKRGIRGNSKIKKVEKWFEKEVLSKDWKVSKEILIGWLNGIIDTDGYFVWNWNENHVCSFRLEVENTNTAIIEQLSKVYDMLGLQYYVIDRKEKNGRDKKLIAVTNDQIRKLLPYLNGLVIKRREKEIIEEALKVAELVRLNGYKHTEETLKRLKELKEEFDKIGVRREW